MNELLIDGKNLIYRSVFAGQNPANTEHVIIICLKQISRYCKDFNPGRINVFWDDRTKNLWRKDIYEDYKSNRSNELSGVINKSVILCIKVFENLGIHQFFNYKNEADDLIFAYCLLNNNNKVVISSDSDLKQIKYYEHNGLISNTKVYCPNKKVFFEYEEHNPAVSKSLMGDKADNIIGYNGIGKVKSAKLSRDKSLLDKFLENNDSIYKRNMLLVDFLKCPYLEENKNILKENMSKPINKNLNKVICILKNDNIDYSNGLLVSMYKNIIKEN